MVLDSNRFRNYCNGHLPASSCIVKNTKPDIKLSLRYIFLGKVNRQPIVMEIDKERKISGKKKFV